MKEQAESLIKDDTPRGVDSDIGAGRKTGLYGCAFLLLAVIIIFIVLILTGIYNPFQGTEGVGP